MKTIRYLLAQRYNWMESQLYARAEAEGYGYVTPAMSRMFGLMGKEPVSLSELARRLMVSRQAVHQMANEAVRHDLVELVDSPTNKRVRLIKFTAKGQEMFARGSQTLERIEGALAERIGPEDLETLRRILAKDWG